MSFAEPARVRCPDCDKLVGPLVGAPACAGCGRRFVAEEGVWDLLPTVREPVKVNEDLAHVGAGTPTWRRLFMHKRYWLEWCDTKWLPTIVDASTRSFLEIGGGLCYASALAKAKAPAAYVVATDVSPRYLRQQAVNVGRILGAAPDVHAAADAEALPFDDGQFDAVYSQVVLYRLADPARALREIARVLAPGGRYLGIERASPWAPLWYRREARTMRARSGALGIGERPIRYREWETILQTSGIGAASLEPVAGRRVRSPGLRRLGNAVRSIYVAIRVTG
jgi:ubiquinone/menaquinone biosynthesis C-methylase UbiE